MEEAHALLELQAVDMQIIRTRRTLEEIPETTQVQQVRAKLKDLAKRTTKIVGLLKDQRYEIQDNERQLVSLTERVEAVNLDNATTTDFRRAKSNNAELDRLAKRLEKANFNKDKAQAEADRLQALLDQAARLREQLESRERELIERLKAKAQDIRDELTRLMGERESLLASVPDDLLARYEASRKAHAMVGVSSLEGGSCSGCRVQLQASQLDALRQGPDISTCPVCGRILVVRK